MAQAKMDFIVNTRVDKTAFVELKREIQALRGLTEKDLINFGSASDFQEAKKQLAAIKSSATTVEAALNKAFSPKLGTVSLTRFNNELKKIDLQGLANNFSKAGAAGTAAFRSLTTNVLTTKIQVKETHKLLDDMGKTMSNTIKWGISSSAWNSVTGSFQKAYNYVKDLDRSLNDIRIVSGKSAEEMERFAIQANRAAKTLGSTTRDYTDASLIYYQQGLPEEEVIKRTNTTIKMANVLGTNAEEVSDYMTSIWNNFDDGSKSIEYYADVITKLGAATASSAEEISTGLEKFSAIAKTTGLSYEYATAALTTVTAKTRQSAEVVGTAFKTLFARIQDLELGNTLDDGTTLGKYSEALYKVGINIKDSNGEMKKMDDILDEMGKKWATLGDAEKAALAQTVAGTRQYAQLVALMDGWDDFQKNLNTANNATGELNKQQATYLESTQAHLDKLSASTERLYKSIIDSEGLNDLIDIFSGLVTGVAEYTEAIGGSKSALLQLGSVLTKVFGRTISQSIATSISNIKKLTEQAEDFNAQTQILQQFKGIQVTDESYQNLLKMAEGVNKYKDTLSEAQIEEANAIMSGYNDAVNARDKWQEAKTYAENYYKFFTEEEAGSLDHTFSNEQLDEYFKNLNTKIGEYEQSLGASKKEINQNIEDREADTVGEYIDSARRMIEDKVIKNEKLEIKLKAILENYSKAGELITEEGNKKYLSDKQVEALKNFGDVYGEIADGILKDTKKVRDTFVEAQKGMSDAYNTAVDEMGETWKNKSEDFSNQYLIQNFTDLTGQIMSISSAIQSVETIPSIWGNQDLTVGEKILQTAIALGSAFNGLAQTFKMTHTVAEILRGTIYKNAAAWAVETETQKVANDQTEDNIKMQAILQDTIDDGKPEFDQAQNEYVESSQRTVQNTALVDDNTRAIRQQTVAIMEQNKVKNQGAQRKTALTNDLFDEVAGDGVDKSGEAIDRAADFMKQILPEDELQSEIERIFKLLKEKINKEKTSILEGDDANLLGDVGFATDEQLMELASKKAKESLLKKKQKVVEAPNSSKKENTQLKFDFDNANKILPEVAEKADDVKSNIDKTNEALQNMKDGVDKNGGKNKYFETLKADLSTIGMAITKIPPQSYIAAAAIAAIGVAIWAAYEKATKAQDQINNLNKAAETLQAEYENVNSKINEIESAISGYEDLITVLNGCTKGTKEWNDALNKVNSTALNILATYPELAKIENLFTRINGVLQIDEDAYNEYIDKLNKKASIIQISGITASTTASKNQVELDKNNLLKDIKFSMQAKTYNPNEKDYGSERAQKNFNLVKENYDKLAGLTGEEYKVKLKSIGVEDVYIKSLTEYQKEIDNNVEEAKNCATEMSNVSMQLANIRIGDTADENTVNTQLILAENDLNTKTQEYTNKWLESITNGGISKFSGGKNEKYLDLMGELKNVEGYKDIEAVRNGVQGTDNNREIIYRINGEEIKKTAEAWASIVGTNQAYNESEKVNYEEQAKNILKPIEEALGGDTKLADLLVQAVASKDYSNLSQENYQKIQTAYDAGNFENILTDEGDYSKLGLDFKNAFNIGIKTAIEEWDPKEAEEALRSKLNSLYKDSAKNLDIDEDMLRIFVDGLKENSKEYEVSEEKLIELAKSAIKFQKTLKTLGNDLEDNKDLFNEWAKSEKSAADLGIDTANAVGKLKSGLKDLLGLDVDEKFLKENFNLIQKAIKGDINALNDLEVAAGKDFIVNLDIEGIEDIYAEYDTMFAQLANTDLEIGAVFNDEEALAKLQQFFATAKLNQKQAQDVLDTYGYEGDLEKIDVPAVKGTRREPVSTITGWRTVQADPAPFYTPSPNGKGYQTVTVPGNVYREPIYETKYIEKEYEVSPATSYYVLRSSKGPSKNGKIQTSGLVGSLTSKGAGRARASAVSSGVGGGGSRGGSSGSQAKPKVEKHREDDKDIYHDVDISLSQISNSLDKVQSKTDQLVGESKINNLTEQFRLLNKQINETNKKIDIAKGEMNSLQSELIGSGVKFNVDGTIANYASAYDAQLASLNRIIDHYNSLSADGQENYQDTLDKANENFDKFLENISRYDEILTSEIPEMEADIYDAIISQIELKLEAFNQEIEIRLEMAEAERDWNEFFNKVIKDIDEDDILGNAEARLEDFMSYYKDTMKGVVQVNTQHIQDILADLKAMDEGLAGKFYSKDGVDNRAQALEDLKNYYEQLMSDLEEIHDLQDEIHESYVDMIDEAQEKFDEQVETFETINNLLEHNKNVISMIYGEESYSALSQFYDKQEENYNKQLDFQRQQVEFWKMQMETAEKDSDAWNAAKENWLSAVDAWNSSIETAIQNLQDKYLNAINAIFQNLNNQVTNGMGLDFIETEWDLINQNADQYLDTVNAIYKVQELQNKYLDAIDKTDSPTQQKKLNDLMQQETNYLREQDKLSEYDLERANLKYELALKQIALEEAQQNKTQLRLRRDSQGNYTYQYTQNDDQIASIQKEITDLYNQLYNLDAEQYRGNLDELYSVWSEFQERMAEAAQINDPEKRAAKELLIKQQYSDLINGLVEKNENLQANLYQSTMSHLFDLYDQNTANYEDMSVEQKEILDQFINAETNLTGAAFDNMFDLYNINIEQFKSMTDEQQDILMNSMIPQWSSGIQQMADKIAGEGGFTGVCKNAFEELDQATEDYMTGLEELQKNANVSFEDVKNGIDNVVIETEKLLDNNSELINQYSDEIDAIRSVINELDDLITKYKDAEAAAKAASEEAYKYWQEEQNRNASADNIIDAPVEEEEIPITNPTPVTPAPAEPPKPSLSLGSYVSVKPGTKWYADSWGGGSWGYARAGSIAYTSSGPYGYNIGGLGWVRKSDIVGYDTGGYTGNWNNNNGRLAMLHQKELVVNANDTSNMLNAITILRDITANLGATLLNKMASISAGGASSIGQGLAAAGMEQNVVINAEFPNATNSREIEDALNNLVNRASQYITK